MSSCCQQIYDTAFDVLNARQELLDYHAKGVKKNSRSLIELVKKLPMQGKSLLDIGGGIGTIAFELLPNGLSRATHNDISKAYSEIFLEEAIRLGYRDKVDRIQGDFPKISDQVEAADLVTLDKAICCYEDYDALVKASVRKCLQWYVYSIPRDVWWVKWGHSLRLGYKRLRGRKFRTYIHSEKAIERILSEAGFRPMIDIRYREWSIRLFEK